MGLNQVIKIGARIKQLRIKKGITQKKMADLCGITHSTYSNYENDNREPSLDVIQRIADKLDISVPDLMGISDLSSRQRIENDLKSMRLEHKKTFDKWVDDDEKDRTSKVHEKEQIELLAEKYRMMKAPEQDVFMEILSYLSLLNIDGQNKAVEFIEMVSKISEYQKHP